MVCRRVVAVAVSLGLFERSNADFKLRFALLTLEQNQHIRVQQIYQWAGIIGPYQIFDDWKIQEVKMGETPFNTSIISADIL